MVPVIESLKIILIYDVGRKSRTKCFLLNVTSSDFWKSRHVTLFFGEYVEYTLYDLKKLCWGGKYPHKIRCHYKERKDINICPMGLGLSNHLINLMIMW